MTRTETAAPYRPRYRPHRRTRRLFGTILAVVMLLVPVAYLFGQVWTLTGNAAEAVATERTATAYARPLTTLLGALVDARNTAARGMVVDDAQVRAAIDEVNGVDPRPGGPVRVGPRWERLTSEIHGTLARNPSGPDALRAYATPITLTQALLTWIADSSQVAGDPASPRQLTDVALRQLPSVVAATGEMTALASTAENPAAPTPTRPARPGAQPDPRVAIVDDRLTRTADDIGASLRAGTDRTANYVVDLRILAPLDEFAAATDELSQATARLGGSDSGARDSLDAAGARVKTAALTLETAVLNAVDTQLAANAGKHTTRHRILLLTGAVIPLALGALLWLQGRGPVAPGGGVPGDRQRSTADASEAGADHPERAPDLVDARDLPATGAVHASRDRN